MNDARPTGTEQSIPQDVEIITWDADMDRVGHALYARRTGHPLNLVWMLSSPMRQISEDDLLVLIGDSRYTALQPVLG